MVGGDVPSRETFLFQTALSVLIDIRLYIEVAISTINNPRVGNAVENIDRRSKRSCSNTVFCISFTW